MSDNIRVRLLSDGGYGCMDKVEFPVEVDAIVKCDGVVDVSGESLVALGAMRRVFEACDAWVFFVGLDCEVVK